jgi:hypothetical protein
VSGTEPLLPVGKELDQGDVLADVPFVKWEGDKASPGKRNPGLITSHGCTCEDYYRALKQGSSAVNRVWVQVAPLRPASDFDDKTIAEVREGVQLDRFFVEGDGSRLRDQVAILTREQPFQASLLAGCKRAVRIADWQWERLLIHMTVSRFHARPEQIFRDELLTREEGGDE